MKPVPGPLSFFHIHPQCSGTWERPGPHHGGEGAGRSDHGEGQTLQSTLGTPAQQPMAFSKSSDLSQKAEKLWVAFLEIILLALSPLEGLVSGDYGFGVHFIIRKLF